MYQNQTHLETFQQVDNVSGIIYIFDGVHRNGTSYKAVISCVSTYNKYNLSKNIYGVFVAYYISVKQASVTSNLF